MPNSSLVDWIILGLLGFGGGVAVNIVSPRMRGAWGFIGASMVGLFCGLTAGMTANAFELHVGWQRFLTAIVGVLGYQILSFLGKLGGATTINNQIQGNVQQNIAQAGGNAQQRENSDDGE